MKQGLHQYPSTSQITVSSALNSDCDSDSWARTKAKQEGVKDQNTQHIA